MTIGAIGVFFAEAKVRLETLGVGIPAADKTVPGVSGEARLARFLSGGWFFREDPLTYVTRCRSGSFPNALNATISP